MVYLVIISLTLHLVSFFVMVILYQKIEQQKPVDQGKTMREMEDLLISYTSEMKENNERLVRRMTKLSPSSIPDTQSDEKNHDSGELDQKNNTPSSLESIDGKGMDDEGLVYPHYSPPISSGDKDEVSLNSSSTANVLSLSKQGYSVSEIAKRLQMGAGEVELLLKFYK
ncbi:DUF6115 domain-containing protein [Salipaludibacillus sp. HK11]|uniref:DUF6115 domain-containing protein n=1 Tax=Salipaludibacillus sp. HK11 TaxID=3394320 RepID=UPI0039FC1181